MYTAEKNFSSLKRPGHLSLAVFFFSFVTLSQPLCLSFGRCISLSVIPSLCLAVLLSFLLSHRARYTFLTTLIFFHRRRSVFNSSCFIYASRCSFETFLFLPIFFFSCSFIPRLFFVFFRLFSGFYHLADDVIAFLRFPKIPAKRMRKTFSFYLIPYLSFFLLFLSSFFSFFSLSSL